jgi:hypothetical protein
MLKFWDNYESFSDQEVSLLNALYDSHQECTYRKNCSTQALTASATGAQCLTQSIAAALMTIGKVHGPVEETYNFLQRGVSNDTLLPPRVPGFGNGFIKGKPDPGLKSIHDFLTEHYPSYIVLLSQIQTRLLAERGKDTFSEPGGLHRHRGAHRRDASALVAPTICALSVGSMGAPLSCGGDSKTREGGNLKWA